jgi:hypothetical protein
MKKKLRKVMKVSPVQHVKSMMVKWRKSGAEVAELRGMLAEKTARRAELETTGNLNDSAVTNELCKLQVLVDLLPRRIAFKEDESARVEENLVSVTNEFIREHLGPRVRELMVRTRVVVEKDLATHIHDGPALIGEVAGSERVREVQRLDWSMSLQPERGAMAHAEGAIKAWVAAGKFEKTLLADECLAGDCLKS